MHSHITFGIYFFAQLINKLANLSKDSGRNHIQKKTYSAYTKKERFPF